MYYNAAGEATANPQSFESIAIAVSNDMQYWKRFSKKPIITKGRGIAGDAQVVKTTTCMYYFISATIGWIALIRRLTVLPVLMIWSTGHNGTGTILLSHQRHLTVNMHTSLGW